MRITIMGMLVLIGGFFLVSYVLYQLQLAPTASNLKIDEQPNPFN